MDSHSAFTNQQSLEDRLRTRGNGFTPFVLSGSETIPELFARQVAIHANKTAIVSDGGSYSYEQLDQRSLSVGFTVMSEATPGRSPVGLLITNHALFLAAALGVLRCGGSYVPLDPTFPEDRNARIIEVSEAQVILTERQNQELAERLARMGQQLIYVDEIERWDGSLPHISNPDDLAYIIFTSGSTGTPKGVMQTHQNVLQVAKRYTNSLCVGPLDRLSMLSSCSVTASVAPFMSSLLTGATLLAFPVRERGLDALADWLDRSQITLYHSVPSLFRHLMKSVAETRVFQSVDVVRMGGDSVYKSDFELFTKHFRRSAVLVNSYGCSEMSSVARFYLDAESTLVDDVVPVGFPLPDVEIAVRSEAGTENKVDALQVIQSPVAVGEIVLKSRYLSPGYWNDDPANCAFSVCAGDATGMRVYRSGDLGSIRPGYGLIHMGRADAQVKLSGFRVELAEVDACLRSCHGVREAIALAHTPEHGERELLGFVELDAGSALNGTEIRTSLQRKLPLHMVPTAILVVATMPFTPNGKVDRPALIKIWESMRRDQCRQGPRTPVEEALSEIWKQVLSLDQVGVDDDFFELGGNSLLGMRLVARVAERLSAPLRAIDLFRHPTIKQFAELVTNNGGTPSSTSPEQLAPEYVV